MQQEKWHCESVIVLLPKEVKDSADIKNWRPITLSNCDTKIITKALAIRMVVVLDVIRMRETVTEINPRKVFHKNDKNGHLCIK